MFENPRRGRQARNFTTNVPKILDLKSSFEQIFSPKIDVGCPWFTLIAHNTDRRQNHAISRVSWIEDKRPSVKLMSRKENITEPSLAEKTHESGRRTAHAVHANLNKEHKEVWKWFRDWTRWSWTLKNARCLFSGESLMPAVCWRCCDNQRGVWLTLDDSLNFVKHVAKISTEERSS